MPRVRSLTAPSRTMILTVHVAFLAGLSATAHAAVGATDRAALAESGKVGAPLLETFRTSDTARVVVAFAVDVEGLGLATEAGRARVRSVGDRILATLLPGDLTAEHRFRIVPGFSGIASVAGVLRLTAHPEVLRIDLEEGGAGHLSQAVPLVRIDDLRSLGLSGAGVTVAVLDSGYDSDHTDLDGDLAAEECFCSDNGNGCCPNGGVTQSGPGSAEDDHGHGTNVSGIITSTGTIAPEGGAPDAEVVAIKVLDSNNSFCCLSDVTDALEWIISDQPSVSIVNMSLGTFALFSGTCDSANAPIMLMAQAIDQLRANGVTTFASSGNDGSGTLMTAPACIANVLSVGAVWDANVGSQNVFCFEPTTQADQVTCFSNSNSTTDLFAPGAPTTSTGMGGGTSTFYGTSQASPLAASCAALLLENNSALTPAQIEAKLESSPVKVTDTTNGLDFPRLDCWDALGLLFADGFESGNTSAWSLVVP